MAKTFEPYRPQPQARRPVQSSGKPRVEPQTVQFITEQPAQAVPAQTAVAKPKRNWVMICLVVILSLWLAFFAWKSEFGSRGPVTPDNGEVVKPEAKADPAAESAGDQSGINWLSGKSQQWGKAKELILSDDIDSIEKLKEFMKQNNGSVDEQAFAPVEPVLELINGEKWDKQRAAAIAAGFEQGYAQ